MRASLVEQHGRIHGRIKVANASRSSISVLASQSTEAWRCRCGDIRMCGPCLAFIRVTGLGLGGAGHAGEASRLGCLPPKLPPHATQARSQAKPACFASLPCHTGFSHPLLLAAQRRTRPPAASRPAPRPLPNPVIENIGPISPPAPAPASRRPTPLPLAAPPRRRPAWPASSPGLRRPPPASRVAVSGSPAPTRAVCWRSRTDSDAVRRAARQRQARDEPLRD